MHFCCPYSSRKAIKSEYVDSRPQRSIPTASKRRKKLKEVPFSTPRKKETLSDYGYIKRSSKSSKKKRTQPSCITKLSSPTSGFSLFNCNYSSKPKSHAPCKSYSTTSSTKSSPKKKYRSGGSYTGDRDVVSELRHGIGTYVYPNGETYTGEWKNGLRSGKGVYLYSDGSRYKGEYLLNLRHGKGTYTYKNGDKYRGSYHKGKRQGTGKFTFKSGKIYKGQYKSDKRHGKGVIYYVNGDRLEIGYYKGKRHGKGKYFFVDGVVQEVEFRQDKLVMG